jgi:predicted dehydrogenase
LRFSRSYGPGRYDPQYEEGGVDYPVGYVRWTEGRNIGEVVRLMASGMLQVDDLVSASYDIAQAPAAYARLAHGERVRAIVLTYPTPAKDRVLGPLRLAESTPTGQTRAVLRVSVCGAGNFARKTLLPGMSATGRVTWSSIATATGVTGVHVGKKLGFLTVVGEAKDAAEDPAADAVLIATRHDTHASLAAAAASSGKHVFVEKPLAITRSELQQLVTTSNNDRIVTGFNRRWSPAALDLSDLLTSRTDPLLIQIRVNAGALPPGHWASAAAQGGRLIGELCHFVDLACYFCGSPVIAMDVAGTGRMAPRVEDSIQVILRYADGSTAALTYCSNGGKSLPKERIELHWEGRSGVIDDFRRWEIHGGRSVRRGERKQNKGHRRLLAEFVRYALDGGPSPVPFHQAAHVSDVTLGIVEALERGAASRPNSASW